MNEREIAVKYGYTSWDNLMDGLTYIKGNILEELDKITGKVATLYVERLKKL